MRFNCNSGNRSPFCTEAAKGGIYLCLHAKRYFRSSLKLAHVLSLTRKNCGKIRAWKVEMRRLPDWLTLDDWQSAFPLSCF